ncbi:MAG: monooxygenase [Thermoleophilaceae bacterium]|nr:monooxygenase [Thermoleophilaceae bacterium]
MASEHVDVLIVGAGLSGVGAACHLEREAPGRSYAILEARDAIGGTWDLFRYPGIRSDSDMFTLGYSFNPWRQAKSIADGPSILSYIHETAQEYGVEDAVRLNQRVVAASWSSEEARWTVDVQRSDSGASFQMTCNFLYNCTGYYRYDQGYTPDFDGVERFRGQVVHPQHWPEGLDYTGKRVVVIGSGATAVTLVPAMAKDAAHVTMLQRSPSYVVSLPGRDPLARLLRKLLPTRLVYPAVRWKNVLVAMAFFQLSRRRPRFIKGLIRAGVKRRLPETIDVDTHFRPRYNPWDQRVCLVPDDDLFRVLSDGSASIVTDKIATFTETGIELVSGDEIEADVVVTATGLNLLALGGIDLTVDGRPVLLRDTVGYKGMMLSGVPNLALALGYTNASWTLKCDLCSYYVCRLLNHMEANGYDRCMPLEPDPSLPREPFIDFNSGYVVRSIDNFPKQGPHAPWRLYQNYPRDVLLLKRGEIDDEGIEFSRVGGRDRTPAAA